MKAFADLYRSLDDTTSTNRKIDVMVDYFRFAPQADAIWAVNFLIGRKPRQVTINGKDADVELAQQGDRITIRLPTEQRIAVGEPLRVEVTI